MTPKARLQLWPFFTIELLSLVVWAPIAALAGMGYTPTFSWGNVFLLVFHLYPAYIFLAIPVALALRAFEKPATAMAIVVLPPLLSGSGFLGLYAYAAYESPRQTDGEVKQAKLVFENKCKEAGEKIILQPTEEIESVLVESQPPYSISGIVNGKYSSEGPDGNFYGVTNSGYLKQYEIPVNARTTGGEKTFRRFLHADAVGNLVESPESKFGIRYLSQVSESEMKIGVIGGSLEIFRVEDKSIIARTTYYTNRWPKEFCGYAPDGYFNSFSFLRRALNLKDQYKSAYRVESK